MRHIERVHVEGQRGHCGESGSSAALGVGFLPGSQATDEFTCHWAGCPRKKKAFSARYKLIIHMRVHSGEKPNKCMVSIHNSLHQTEIKSVGLYMYDSIRCGS